MRARFPLLCLSVVVAVFVMTASLSTTDTTTRLQTIRGAFIVDYDAFIEQTKLLSSTLDSAYAGTSTLARARLAYKTMRLSYKKVEMLLEYVDGEYVNSYLNGAPLPKSDRNSSIITIIEPEGQQIIEEMLFSNDALNDSTLAAIASKASLLYEHAKQIRPLLRSTPLADMHCIGMLRQSIVRMVAMGITGFDSPGSGNAMIELRTNAERIAWLAGIYADALDTTASDAQTSRAKNNALKTRVKGMSERVKGLSERVKGLSQGLVSSFAKGNFDSFDRLAFIRDWADPLFGAMLDVQLAMGVESVAEVTSTPQPMNWRARHIFDASLFNALYYTGIPEKQFTAELVSLGRSLFFDPILSTTNDRSCASCHKPERAFTDGETTSIALGHDGNILRNAPTIINAAWADKYFYDLRAARLEDVIEHVVTNNREFGSTVSDMVLRIRASSEYSRMFADAFPKSVGEPIHSWSVGQAIAAYIVSLTGFNSTVDKHLRGEPTTVAASVRRGFNLFMGKAACGTCHFAPTFAGLVPPRFIESESEVLGVPTKPVVAHATLDPDLGRFEGTIKDQVAFLRHSFKTMTVRNVALTAPYMHNGAYKTLEQVVDFYNRGGGDGIGIPLKFQTLPFDKLDLTKKEQRDLISFMKSLTDTAGFGTRPTRLPIIDGNATLNNRVIGGVY